MVKLYIRGLEVIVTRNNCMPGDHNRYHIPLPEHPVETAINILCNVYKMSGRSVSVYTDTSASHEYLCTLIQINGHKFCKLLIKRPQTVIMFSNYI